MTQDAEYEARQVILGEWAHTTDDDLAKGLFPIVEKLPAGPSAKRWQLTLTLVYGLLLGATLASGLVALLWEMHAVTHPEHLWSIIFLVCMALMWRQYHPLRRRTVGEWVRSDVPRSMRIMYLGAWIYGSILGVLALGVAGAMWAFHVSLLALLPEITPVIIFTCFLGYLVHREIIPRRRRAMPARSASANLRDPDAWAARPDPLTFTADIRNSVTWAPRPDPLTLLDALRLMRGQETNWEKFFQQQQELFANPPELSVLFNDLDKGLWPQRLLLRCWIAYTGGAMMRELHARQGRLFAGVRDVPDDLMRIISHDTTAQLAANTDRLLCTTCLVRPGRISDFGISFYGCRQCHQSRDFLEAQEIVALLDAGMTDPQTHIDGVLRVNWLQRDGVFDFNRVEIRNASDFDIEHFCIEVGNDMDPVRVPRYREMTVTVACPLSDNTRAVLEKTFSHVTLAVGVTYDA